MFEKMPSLPGAKSFVVGKININVGDAFEEGQLLFHVETKKGVREIRANTSGIVKALLVTEGEIVDVGQDIYEFTEVERKDKEATSTQSMDTVVEKMPSLPGAKSFLIGKININVGDTLEEGQLLFHVETKKGVREIRALTPGIVKTLFVTEGDTVAIGQDIYELTIEREETTKTEVAGDLDLEELTTELLILGGGTGGYVAAIRAARAGKKVLLVEKNRMGGTCLNIGCIPTKALIASSEKYQSALHAADFGIAIDGKITPDMPKIIAQKNTIVDKLTGGVDYLMEKNNIRVIKGLASFLDNEHVQVICEKKYNISYSDCIIATGSVVSIPSIPGIDLPNILTSTEALDCTQLPNSITVVGGGVIGLEFAFLYRNLGVKVTVIEFTNRLLGSIDADVSETILTIAREKGIDVRLGAKVTKFNQAIDGQIITEFEQLGQACQAISDHVLVAVGRKPNYEDLNLERTTVSINPQTRGIQVDDMMRTTAPHIYAVGDVNNLIQLAHAASYQGMIAVETILGETSRFEIDKIPSVIFTSPEIATVGYSEERAKQEGIDYKVGTFHYEANGKALTMHETEGFIKILKDKDDVIIGGAIIGADASTLIATLSTCVANRMTDEAIENTVFAHPTTAEVIHEASLDLSIGAFHE